MKKCWLKNYYKSSSIIYQLLIRRWVKCENWTCLPTKAGRFKNKNVPYYDLRIYSLSYFASTYFNTIKRCTSFSLSFCKTKKYTPFCNEAIFKCIVFVLTRLVLPVPNLTCWPSSLNTKISKSSAGESYFINKSSCAGDGNVLTIDNLSA